MACGCGALLQGGSLSLREGLGACFVAQSCQQSSCAVPLTAGCVPAEPATPGERFSGLVCFSIMLLAAGLALDDREGAEGLQWGYAVFTADEGEEGESGGSSGCPSPAGAAFDSPSSWVAIFCLVEYGARQRPK